MFLRRIWRHVRKKEFHHFPEAATEDALKVFLKILQYSLENTCAGVSLRAFMFAIY